jgi:hypothetical protein
VGMERGPLNLVSTYLKEKVAALSGKIQITAVGNPPLWLRDTLYPQNLVVISPISGGSSVGIFSWRTEATEFFISPI